MVVVGADRFRRKKPSAAAKVRIADGPDTVNAVRAAPPDVFETDTKTLWKGVEDWTWTESEPPLVTGVLAVTVTLGPPLAAGGAPDWSDPVLPSEPATPLRKLVTGVPDDGGGVTTDDELEPQRMASSAASAIAPARVNADRFI